MEPGETPTSVIREGRRPGRVMVAHTVRVLEGTRRMGTTPDVVVFGDGLAGCSVAYQLGRRGGRFTGKRARRHR